MKKLVLTVFTLLFVAALLLSMSSCGNNNRADAETETIAFERVEFYLKLCIPQDFINSRWILTEIEQLDAFCEDISQVVRNVKDIPTLKEYFNEEFFKDKAVVMYYFKHPSSEYITPSKIYKNPDRNDKITLTVDIPATLFHNCDLNYDLFMLTVDKESVEGITVIGIEINNLGDTEAGSVYHEKYS